MQYYTFLVVQVSSFCYNYCHFNLEQVQSLKNSAAHPNSKFPEKQISFIKELYKGQEAEIRTDCGITEWFKIERSVRQGCILSPYLFNIYAEDIMTASGRRWENS